jgi:tetratricopeptide (TPR) repeat protein
MTVATFTYLLNKPDAVNNEQIISLEKILEDFPYCQSARSLHLKGLYNQDSFKYNQALKSTAAYTTDRTILFDLITAEQFLGIQKELFEGNETQLLDIKVIDSKIVSEDRIQNSIEQSILSSINKASTSSDLAVENLIPYPSSIATTEAILEQEIEKEDNKTESAVAKLEIGKPIPFNQNETHSFQEWLQLSKIKPIDRESNELEKKAENATSLKNQLEIIDKFIKANPKISPVKTDTLLPLITVKTEETSYLMTETLAKVYLEQKKYNKAIQAYEILILKYPEKSSFFANRILNIKSLQQNNNS